ncbi:hypothetical protein LL965_10105 [Xanthomonas cassavae CFBP 4642]|uniref:DUF3019 domain-containing protein n=1 Tax=Xanthomonas cassavae CFBP 4642 TaxID=1219375 RepID=A0ABS8HE99_9XANT|nr:hypothetical protein [Xanthomonas cassavae]MCC4620423.1 hypothetical protein [Xanthomonas cassavae CFBP 4642]
MSHLLGLILALCSPSHCTSALPLDAVQLTLTPTRAELCLQRTAWPQPFCISVEGPAGWMPVRSVEQTWQRLVRLAAPGLRHPH